MAESRKRLFDDDQYKDYKGYINAISELTPGKSGYTKFFKAVIQVGKEEFREVIGFNDKMYSTFATAEQKKSPVKLLKCRHLPGRNSGDEMMIKFTGSSQIIYLDEVDYKFKESPIKLKTVRKDAVNMTIADVKKAPLETPVNVEVKLGPIIEVMDRIVQHDKMMLKKMLVSDHTGYAVLALWARLGEEAEEDMSVRVTNVYMKEFGGELFLNSTRNSRMSGLKEAIRSTTEGIEVNQGKVEQATFSMVTKCGNCGVVTGELKEKEDRYKCPHCEARQLMDALIRDCKGEIRVKQKGAQKVQVGGAVLKKFFQKKELPMLDSDFIENKLMDLPSVRVRFMFGQAILLE